METTFNMVARSYPPCKANVAGGLPMLSVGKCYVVK